jgi:biotin operon repressor
MMCSAGGGVLLICGSTMARKSAHFRGLGPASFLNDRDWIVIITALLHDPSRESRALAHKLLSKSKHGRQIRLIRLIHAHQPSLAQMRKSLGVSRRTVFRYLNSLETYGLTLHIDEQLQYHLRAMPQRFRRLLLS